MPAQPLRIHGCRGGGHPYCANPQTERRGTARSPGTQRAGRADLRSGPKGEPDDAHGAARGLSQELPRSSRRRVGAGNCSVLPGLGSPTPRAPGRHKCGSCGAVADIRQGLRAPLDESTLLGPRSSLRVSSVLMASEWVGFFFFFFSLLRCLHLCFLFSLLEILLPTLLFFFRSL